MHEKDQQYTHIFSLINSN